MFEYPPPLSEVDVLESPDAGRVDLLVAFERSIALLQAAQQQVLASLDGRALDWSGTKLIDYTREQVGAAARLSPGTAERRLSIARTLLERLPATLDPLRRGQLTYLHAMKLAAAVSPFDAETTTKIEQRVLRRAPEQTLAQFGTSLRRAVIAADPRRAEQRHDDAITQRRVVFTPQHDGITKHCGRYYPPTAPRSSRRCSTPSATPRPMTAARINAAPTPSSTCSPAHSLTRPCPNSTASAPPSTSPSHSAPCPAATTSPPTSTGTAPPPPRWHGVSPPTRPAPGGDSSPTTPPNSSTTAAPPTGHPPTSPTTSPPATEPAPSPHADMQPSCATPTTSKPGPTAATQTPRTSPPPAPDTTTPTTTPAGKSNTDKTEPESGPARPDTAISCRRLSIRAPT